MKVYVAGKWKEQECIRKIMSDLVNMGHVITVDWTEHVHPEKSREYALEDIEGVRKCDLLIAYMPNKDVFYKGAWIEIGVALALEKKVLVVGENVNSVFLGHPNVILFENYNLCISYIQNNKEKVLL